MNCYLLEVFIEFTSFALLAWFVRFWISCPYIRAGLGWDWFFSDAISHPYAVANMAEEHGLFISFSVVWATPFSKEGRSDLLGLTSENGWREPCPPFSWIRSVIQWVLKKMIGSAGDSEATGWAKSATHHRRDSSRAKKATRSKGRKVNDWSNSSAWTQKEGSTDQPQSQRALGRRVWRQAMKEMPKTGFQRRHGSHPAVNRTLDWTKKELP